MKSYTDLKQSKELAEILPIKSADMEWNVFVDDSTRCLPINDWDLCKDSCYGVKFYPAWSLAALLSVLPNKIVSHETAFEEEDAEAINDTYYKHIELTEDGRYMCCYVGNGYKYKCVADIPIDACYEMILKLNELNLL